MPCIATLNVSLFCISFSNGNFLKVSLSKHTHKKNGSKCKAFIRTTQTDNLTMNNNRDQSGRQFIGEICWNKCSKLCCAFLDHKSCPGSHCMGIKTAVADRFAFFFVLSFRAWANLLTQLHFLYNYPRETASRNAYSINFLTFTTKNVDQSGYVHLKCSCDAQICHHL